MKKMNLIYILRGTLHKKNNTFIRSPDTETRKVDDIETQNKILGIG